MPRASTPRAMWSGSISFGLVNVPVKLLVAVREENVRFHMLHDQDHARLQRKMVCSADGQEVHPEHIVKGYEISPDQYVVVSDEEIESLEPKASRTIEIHDFVEIDQIDPIFYDRPYYLAPDEHAGKAYQLLVEAMTRSRKIAIATFVMREREYLAALRPVDGVLCLTTLHYNDEVLSARDVTGMKDSAKIDDREVKMAEQLIDSLNADWDPAKYHDEFQDRVKELIERKAAGEEVVTQPPVAERPARAVNLMDALEKSLAEAKKRRGSDTTESPRSRTATSRPAAAPRHPRRRKSA